jgi:phosphoribosyl 1,2-cyclic phosphodiesterase
VDIRIIATGSSGNCFLFNKDIMIDVGLSYSRLSKEVDIKSVKYVLLTHIHGDHFQPSTIRKLFVNTKVVFVCGFWLLDNLLDIGVDRDRIFVAEPNKLYKFGDYKISPFNAYHDVPNFGYRIVYNGHKHFHITDTYTLEGLTAMNYDTATIECNHCIDSAVSMIDVARKNGEFTHLVGAINSHLSVQKTIDFVKANKIKKLYPVHIGSSTKKYVIEKLERARLSLADDAIC